MDIECGGTAFAAAVDAVRGGSDLPEVVDGLLRKLADAELLGLLDGDTRILPGAVAAAKRYMAKPVEAGRVDRLGIPGIKFTDGPRGVSVGNSTSFPVAIARAASWDVALESSIGDAIGKESRVQRANHLGGICVNLAPVPGWGRTQESYGEDPVLLGAMGAALHRGAAPWVMTCVKHFALNSMENARFRVDVRVDDATLHEVYLPHFRTVVEAGVDSVMTSYNSVNGQWAGDSPRLLTDVLRDQWGFRGFVLTDFVFGLRRPVESVAAGQDLEMPFRQQRATALPGALADGRLSRADVERAAGRLLGTQIRLALRARPDPDETVVACAEHRALAREAAVRGSVLLRNNHVDGAPMLPLVDARLVAVLGPLADEPNLGDVGSSRVRPPSSVSILRGLRDKLGDQAVGTAPAGDFAAAAEAARIASAAVVVVGLTSVDEGESMDSLDADGVRLLGGIARWRPAAAFLAMVMRVVTKAKGMGGDRPDLRLHPGDIRLIRTVGAANPRTVVVVIGGGTVVLDPWDNDVAAILVAWYPGMEGGNAIADVLLGDAEPGGRLPVAIPHRQIDLPTVDWTATSVTYGRWWGQRHLDRSGVAAAYPFGFGLGYTEFELADLRVGPVSDERFDVTVRVANLGARSGRHVVQVYATRPNAGIRALVGFEPVQLDAGGTTDVTVRASTRPLQTWSGDGFTLDAMSVTVEAASYSGDPNALCAVVAFGG